MENEEQDKSLKEYVEDKIYLYTFKAKNFSKEEMDIVDDYCKKAYGDNRKLMILDLIRYKEENMAFFMLDEKINFIYNELLSRINNTEVPEKPKSNRVSWKGFNPK